MADTYFMIIQAKIALTSIPEDENSPRFNTVAFLRFKKKNHNTLI